MLRGFLLRCYNILAPYLLPGFDMMKLITKYVVLLLFVVFYREFRASMPSFTFGVFPPIEGSMLLLQVWVWMVVCLFVRKR